MIFFYLYSKRRIKFLLLDSHSTRTRRRQAVDSVCFKIDRSDRSSRPSFLRVPFLRFLFIFLMRSLSSIAPSSYGLFRPRPGDKHDKTNSASVTKYKRVCVCVCGGQGCRTQAHVRMKMYELTGSSRTDRPCQTRRHMFTHLLYQTTGISAAVCWRAEAPSPAPCRSVRTP